MRDAGAVKGCRRVRAGDFSSLPPVAAGVTSNLPKHGLVTFKTRIYSAPDGQNGQGSLFGSARRKPKGASAPLPAVARDDAGARDGARAPQGISPGAPRGPRSGPRKTGSS